jgi:DNA-binding NarL/FixJ family response regulator
MSSVPITILLGEGKPEGLQHVRAFLGREGFDVVGAASDSDELVDLAVSLRPAVVILDDVMPRESALTAAREILSLCRETQVILLTPHGAGAQILTAFRAGIRGYVLEADTTPDLARAIREVSRGRLFLSPGAGRRLTAEYLPQAAAPAPVLP